MKKLLSALLSLTLVLSLGVSALADDIGTFEDIDSEAWYYDEVNYVVTAGLMNGVSSNEFDPNGTLTRAMLVTMLYRAANSPTVNGNDEFIDTSSNEWYSDAVVWASDAGIVEGYGGGLFGTNDTVTREQVAQMLWNYADNPEPEAAAVYSDQASISDWAADAVAWARSTGLMSGRDGNIFAPRDSMTRAEAATILYNSRDMASDEPETPSEGGNTLVVYFSATGHTEAVANYIADATGADVFVIEPAQPYTDSDLNWTDELSRVVQEYEDESLRDVELVSTDVPNWDSYDTVFIGYPIWWGIAAWPVSSFVAANDFTGKTVIPFCTSSSSGLGQSGELLAEAAGTGTWLEGERFSSGASESDVAEWVASLDI